MKRLVYLCLPILSLLNCSAQTKQNDFPEFLKLFNEIKLPYDTDSLNLDFKKYPKVPENLALKYVCNNNREGLKYNYSVVGMDDGVERIGIRDYDFRALFRFAILQNNYVVVTKINESLYIYTNNGSFQQTETKTDTCAYMVDEIARRNVHCTGKLYKALKNDF